MYAEKSVGTNILTGGESADSDSRSVTNELPQTEAVSPCIELTAYPGRDNQLLPPGSLQNRDRKLARTAMTIGLIASLAVGRYVTNVQAGELRHEGDRVSISHVFDAADPASDTMIFDFEGLTGKDASDAAEHEVAYQQLGSLEAVIYGADVNPVPIAEAIIKRTNQSGKHRVGLSARSAGGPIEIAAAAEIATRKMSCDDMAVLERLKSIRDNICPNFDIAFIIEDSSPAGIDSVRPEKLTYNDKFEWALAHLWGIEYSSDVSFEVQAAAMLLNHPELINPDNLIRVPYDATSFYLKVTSSKKASPSLIKKEFDAISAARIQENLDTLGQLDIDERPVLVLMQPAGLADDTTILSDEALHEYQEATKIAGLIFGNVRVPGIVHANPGFKPGEWNQGIISQVIPMLKRLQSLTAIKSLFAKISQLAKDRTPKAGSRAVIPAIEGQAQAIPSTQASQTPQPHG